MVFVKNTEAWREISAVSFVGGGGALDTSLLAPFSAAFFTSELGGRSHTLTPQSVPTTQLLIDLIFIPLQVV